MKVLFVAPCYYPAKRYGGPIKSIHKLAANLVKLGCHVEVFTTNIDGPDVLNVPIGDPVIQEGVIVHYYPVGILKKKFTSKSLAMALRNRLKEFDIVHINWLYVYTTLVAARECLKQKVPYVLSPRGMLDKNAIKMKGMLKKTIYLSLVEKKHIQGAAAIHYTAYGEKENSYGISWNKNNVVVFNGMDVDGYSELVSEEIFLDNFSYLNNKKRVLFLGRINYIKGLDLLAGAWPDVLREVPDAHLVLAGPDDDVYASKVKDMFRKNGCDHTVTFVGMLDGNMKHSALACADVFVASSYLESFGMAIVEAMACGKPVVVTNRVNICAEIEDFGGGLVVPCEPHAIAKALVCLIKNQNKARDMGLNGRRLVEQKFAWERLAKEMSDVYTSAIERTTPKRGVQ